MKKLYCVFFRQSLRASACSVLADIKEKAIDYSVLGIDEGQFVSLAFIIFQRLSAPCR